MSLCFVRGVIALMSVFRFVDSFSRVVIIVHPFLDASSVRNFSLDMYGHMMATYGYFSSSTICVTWSHMLSKNICLLGALCGLLRATWLYCDSC